MAVSNAIGSNVFDINLGIGLPFVIRGLIDNFEPIHLLTKEEEVGCKIRIFVECMFLFSGIRGERGTGFWQFLVPISFIGSHRHFLLCQ